MKRVIAMSFAGILMLGSISFAQFRPSGIHSRAVSPLASLSDEQREEIINLRQEWEKQRVQIEADQKSASIELQQILEDESASESEIRSQLEEIASYSVDLRMGAITLRSSVKNVLTPEQWEQFQQRGMLGMFGHENRMERPDYRRDSRSRLHEDFYRDKRYYDRLPQRFDHMRIRDRRFYWPY